MTREETINYFHKFMDNEPISIPELEKAMQVAIKALEQEPCEDAVSRKAVLDVIEREQFKGDAISEIEKLPPVNQQEPRWIPISERLPETDTEVLATTIWGEVTIADRIGKNTWFIQEGSANAYTEDIIAWMPKPKAYKRGEKE